MSNATGPSNEACAAIMTFAEEVADDIAAIVRALEESEERNAVLTVERDNLRDAVQMYADATTKLRADLADATTLLANYRDEIARLQSDLRVRDRQLAMAHDVAREGL